MKKNELKKEMDHLFCELFGDNVWFAVTAFRLRDLGKWDSCDGSVTFTPECMITFRELKAIAAMITSDTHGYDATADFIDPYLRRWYNSVRKTNRNKNNPFLCGAILAVWERVPMTVDTDGRIVLDGEPDYCPLFAPARDLWKIMKGEKQMSEVKVTIEWNTDNDPMRVHFAEDADPNKVIGAVMEAMGFEKRTLQKECHLDEFTHINLQGDKVVVTRHGQTHTFPTWCKAVDWICGTIEDDVE